MLPFLTLNIRKQRVFYLQPQIYEVQVPLLFEIVKLLCFYKRPSLVPVLANREKPSEDFSYYEKRWKAKTPFSICFAVNNYRGHMHPSSESGTAKLHPGTILSKSTRALSCVYEHVCFILVYFTHVLARCVQMKQKSPRELVRVLHLAQNWM